MGPPPPEALHALLRGEDEELQYQAMAALRALGVKVWQIDGAWTIV